MALEWKEVSPGKYARDLDALELFYVTLVAAGHPLNREHFTITATAKFKFDTNPDDLVDRVRQAWKTLRYDHPSMGTTIVDGQRFYDVVASQTQIDNWVKETFFVVDGSAAELFPELYLSKQTTLYLLPQTSEVLIRCPHERSDGFGMIHFLNNLFELMSQPKTVQFGDEVKNLSPCLMVATKTSTATEEQKAKVMEEITTFVTAQPSIGLPATNTSALPSKIRRAGLKFSKEDSAAVIAAAKAHGLTVTHAVHAAIILATKRLGAGGDKYAAFWMINVRIHCEPPFNSTKHPAASYHWGGSLVVSPTNFEDTARKVKKIYQDKRADEDLLPMFFNYAEVLTPAMAQPPPTPPSEPTLSSMGILDAQLQPRYGSIAVEDFWIAVDMLTPEVATFLWCRQGVLELSGTYNEAYYEAGVVDIFLALVKDILFDGLGV